MISSKLLFLKLTMSITMKLKIAFNYIKESYNKINRKNHTSNIIYLIFKIKKVYFYI